MMGYGDYGKNRPVMKTTKTLKAHGTSISAVELREFLEGLPDGQEIQVRVSEDQMRNSALNFTATI